MGHALEFRFDRRRQGRHDLGFDLVRQVPRLGNILISAPAVLDFLVLGQRIGDQREGADGGLEGFSQGLPAGLTRGRVLGTERVQRRLDCQLLAIQLEAETRHGFIEQAVPCRCAGHALLKQQLLQIIRELIGPPRPRRSQPRAVSGEVRMLSIGRLKRLFLEPVDIQGEEQNRAADCRQLLLHIAIELGIGGPRRIRCVDEPRKRGDPAHAFIERLIGLDRFCQQCAAGRVRQHVGNPARIGFRKPAGLRRCHGQIGKRCCAAGKSPLRFIFSPSGIEIRQVPGRKVFAGIGCQGEGAIWRGNHAGYSNAVSGPVRPEWAGDQLPSWHDACG